jgi:surface carbohydrate biosynthesis protein
LEPVAYLHCELKSRDFESRLFIAAELARLGYTVIVGQVWNIYANLLHTAPPVGAHLFSTCNAAQAIVMKLCREHGRPVIGSDQEALPFSGRRLLDNVTAEALAACDVFLAQNAAHADIIARAYPAMSDRLRVAGSARIDALRAAAPERPVATPYILFNTGFGLINSIWGGLDQALYTLAVASGIDPKTLEGKRELNERVTVESAVHAAFSALIEGLLADRKIDIVVRPHPSENAETWRTAYAGKPGITIVAGSDPIAWAKHAELLIHSDSTTGLEAAILGVRCLNIAPGESWSDRFVMRRVNPTVASAKDAKERIDALLATGRWDTPAIPVEMFPADAAKTTARELAAFLPPPGPVRLERWGASQRTEVQRAKFTVSEQDLFGAFTPIAQRIERRLRVQSLTDSVFLIAPAV